MNISQAAAASGLPVKTLRYYEQQGLVVPERQPGNSYRAYTSGQVERLRMLQRARAAGLSLAECRRLLDLLSGTGEQLREALPWLVQWQEQIDQQLLALTGLQQNLSTMVQQARALQSPQRMPFMLLGEA